MEQKQYDDDWREDFENIKLKVFIANNYSFRSDLLLVYHRKEGRLLAWLYADKEKNPLFWRSCEKYQYLEVEDVFAWHSAPEMDMNRYDSYVIRIRREEEQKEAEKLENVLARATEEGEGT